MSDISTRIIERAKELNLSQSDIARKLGYSRASVGLWFKPKASLPSADKIHPLAEVLGVSCNWLLSGEEYSPSKQTPQE